MTARNVNWSKIQQPGYSQGWVIERSYHHCAKRFAPATNLFQGTIQSALNSLGPGYLSDKLWEGRGRSQAACHCSLHPCGYGPVEWASGMYCLSHGQVAARSKSVNKTDL